VASRPAINGDRLIDRREGEAAVITKGDGTMRRDQTTGITRRRLLGTTAAGAGAIAAGGLLPRTGGRVGAQEPQTGGRLIIGTPQPIQTFDSDNPGLANNQNTFPGLYNGLTKFDDEMNPIPDLAESWEPSADGLTWTFKLRAGVKFHNGREVTADDVKWTIERILNPEKASYLLTQFDDIESVDSDGALTATLHMKAPNAALLSALVDAKIKAQENDADIVSNPIGTGPFKLKEYAVNDKVVLERNPDYWEAGKPYLDEVVIQTLADPTALFTSFTSDAVDAYWQLGSKFVAQLEGDPDHLVLQPAKSSVYTLFMLDEASAPFNDVRARQALLHLMDRETMLEVAYFGLGTVPPSNNPVPPGHPVEKTGYPEFPYDVEKGKALFAEVGVTELKFIAPAVNPEWKPISEVLERSFSEAGIKLTIELVEVNEWLTLVAVGNTWPGVITTNIYLTGWDPALMLRPYQTGVNRHNYSNPALDDALTRGKREMDPEARIGVYGEAQDIILADLPTAVIAHWKWSHGVHSKVQGLRVLYSGHLDYREAWIDG
jgi:peptide/nickel transport system substrate-binding protein